MAKKNKARSKNKNEDDGTEVYDETEDEQDEKEWVEEPAPAGIQTSESELESVKSMEATRDLPEPDRSEPPLRPEEQEPEPYGSDISPNQAFNVKAGSMPEDRPDHDKPIGEKGKDPAYGYDVVENDPPKGRKKEK